MSSREDIRWLKRHGPSWLAAVALHLIVLIPLCLVTWAVGTAIRTDDQLLTLSPRQEAKEPTGDERKDDNGASGNDVNAGAAGGGNDSRAPGLFNDAFAALPPAPTPAALPAVANAISTDGMAAPSGGVDSTVAATNRLIHNLSGTASGIPGGGGLGGRGFGLEGTGTGFGQSIGKMRETGLDVVFVLDATDSMNPYIGQAKQRLADVLNVIDGLVPGAGVGVVAYKDYGDDYGPTAVKSLKISKDHKAIRAFIDDITAGGGGDEPEPINEALKVAVDAKGMGWTGGRKRVIILIGDSTIHPSGRQEAFRLAKQFAAEMKGTINIIDTGGVGEQTKRREQVQPDLRTIAKEGGGSAFLLGEEQTFWRYLIVSVFGEQFKNDVDTIIGRYVQTGDAATKPAEK